MIPLPLMKKATTLLFIFQLAVLIILFAVHQTDNGPKYHYNMSEIAISLDSQEFAVPVPKDVKIVRAKDNICLDSEGVYRQCDDDDYEKQVLLDRLVTHSPDTNEMEEEEAFPNAVLDTGSIKSLNRGDRTAFGENSLPWDDFEPYYRTTGLEAAVRQFSGTKGAAKNISKRVPNADKRFVSDQRILYSEVYEQTDMTEDVDLLVIVSSAANKRARRDSIRGTWWMECLQNSKVRCFFFTDDINSPEVKEMRRELLHEKKKYDDVVFQPIGMGLHFGYRFLYQMQWAVAHYRFKYLLRVDDDVIVCLHHLLHDLPSMRNSNLQWGYLHCAVENVVYIDEGLTMLSRDLILRFLSQDPLKMRCHVYGDQQIAIWINDLNLDQNEIYAHDSRIHHTPPASSMREYFFELEDICAKHIIIHGIYPDTMDEFWVKKRSRVYSKYREEPISNACDKDISFVWYHLGRRFYHQPKYCFKKPTWDTSHMQGSDGTFKGRENEPEETFHV